jgi:hypothetical protein
MISTRGLLLTGGAVAVAAVVAFSCTQETAGYSTYHEVACAQPGLRGCGPSGRYLTIDRDRTRQRVTLSIHDERGLPWTTEQLEGCVLPDGRNFQCRRALSVGIAGGVDDALPGAPWRMTQGRLVDARERAGRSYWVDPLTYWRRRLLFGGWDG